MAKLISGKTYSLEEIFSGENDKVIIPDLQRDYCWGNPLSSDSDSLVSGFLDTLLKLDRDRDITMGLIYGYYKDEYKPYHLQLCDGQQRLTTLFLILGILNRKCGDNRYKKYLVSDFEWNEDDKETHLLYSIRESSIYFLSDLTAHFFLNNELTLNQVREQYWFINVYGQDPTINSMLAALDTIESKLSAVESGLNNVEECREFGDLLLKHIKFLFHDMGNRQNGEETFVVINTTGEPLSANQNLKPLIIIENEDYEREGYNTAHDWEVMETWFWKKRHRNNNDTSTEGMLAFLHCARVIYSKTEDEWYHNIETDDDKFPLSISMVDIWNCFIAYKRIYELDYSSFHIDNVSYPDSQSHYTQKSLYALLPTMAYCMKYPNVDDRDIQRVFHLFTNMARYRNVNRSSKNESLNVPAFRACRIIRQLDTKDVLSLLQLSTFNIEEERKKLLFIEKHSKKEHSNDLDIGIRIQIEDMFSEAESFPIYEGQIATLVDWSQSVDQLKHYCERIKELWITPESRNKLRRALLAFKMDDYPMKTNSANDTLCSGTEWRTLFEKQAEKMKSFIDGEDDLDPIIEKADKESPFYLIIKDAGHLDFCMDHKIRIFPKKVIELMNKTYASADFKLFHNGEVFEKRMIDMTNWNGFWVWSDGYDSVFYTISLKFNLTLDMKLLVSENGIYSYKIVAWLNRRPNMPSMSLDFLIKMGFENKDELACPIINSVSEAKQKFIGITKQIDDYYKAKSQ